ncbi:MAG: YqgE/AlgH family protein [Dehalococcoidia bacterium]
MTESLTGKLLLASLRITEPTFFRTVVLMCAHDENGALGVVINRPLKSEAVASHMPQFEELVREPVCIFHGGPVESTAALALGRWKPVLDIPAPKFVVGRTGLLDLSTPASGLAPNLEEVRLFAGYAGWSEGQLEGELKEESWFVVDALEEDIFSNEPEQLWRNILRRQAGNLAMFAWAPKDPAVN